MCEDGAVSMHSELPRQSGNFLPVTIVISLHNTGQYAAFRHVEYKSIRSHVFGV